MNAICKKSTDCKTNQNVNFLVRNVVWTHDMGKCSYNSRVLQSSFIANDKQQMAVHWMHSIVFRLHPICNKVAITHTSEAATENISVYISVCYNIVWTLALTLFGRISTCAVLCSAYAAKYKYKFGCVYRSTERFATAQTQRSDSNTLSHYCWYSVLFAMEVHQQTISFLYRYRRIWTVPTYIIK